MASSEEWFVGERAENLAIVLLTRFPVSVTRDNKNSRGADLRVTLDPHKPGFREFGVEIKGTTYIRQLFGQHIMSMPMRFAPCGNGRETVPSLSLLWCLMSLLIKGSSIGC